MAFWEYVFLRRVALRDRVQSAWFRPVLDAYAYAQAENRRLLAANASAVALAAASTAAATGATDIAATITAAARGKGILPQHPSLQGAGGDAGADSAASVAAGARSTLPHGRTAAGASKQNILAAATQRDGALRQAPAALFAPIGEAAGPSSTTTVASSSLLSKRQEAVKRTLATATAAAAGATRHGNFNSSSAFNASALARHFRRGGTRDEGDVHSINTMQPDLARSESNISDSRRTGHSISEENSRDGAAAAVAAWVGSSEVLHLQFLLQQEVQHQLQQQQLQQLRLLASSSMSTMHGLLASSNSQDIAGAGGAAVSGLLPTTPMAAGGAAGGPGKFSTAAAALLQQQQENSLAVQLLQQQVEQLQKQVEEKTGESSVLRRLVTEREEELKEKEKEIADSKKACFLLQSERKHLSKALHAAQQEGMEKALENERYLRELLRHKEAEAVRLNEVQQLYVSLMHQQQQQQPVPLLHAENDGEDNEGERQHREDFELQQQDDGDEQQQSLQQKQQHEAVATASLQDRGRYADERVTAGDETAIQLDSGSDGSLVLEELPHPHGAAAAPSAEARAANREAPDPAAAAVVAAGESPSSVASVAALLRVAEAEKSALIATREDVESPEEQQQQQHQQLLKTAGDDNTANVERQPGPEAAGAHYSASVSSRMQWLDVASDDRRQGQQSGDVVCGNIGAEDFSSPREALEGVREAPAAPAVPLSARDEKPVPDPSPLLTDTLPVAGTALATEQMAAKGDESSASARSFSTTLHIISETATRDAAGAASPSAITGAVSPATGDPSAAGVASVGAFSGGSSKGSVAAPARASSSQKSSAASATATSATSTVELPIKSNTGSSSRPLVMNPLLQLLSLSPSWARGAGKSVLRGSPAAKPAAGSSDTISSSSSAKDRAKQAPLPAGQAATRRTSSTKSRDNASAASPGTISLPASSEAARLAALETSAVEGEDEEWGVVGYLSHSRHSSSEPRAPPQTDTTTRREGQDTHACKDFQAYDTVSDTAAEGSSPDAAAAGVSVVVTRRVSGSSSTVSASAVDYLTVAAHAVSAVGSSPAAVAADSRETVAAATVTGRGRTQAYESGDESLSTQPVAIEPSVLYSAVTSDVLPNVPLPDCRSAADGASVTGATAAATDEVAVAPRLSDAGLPTEETRSLSRVGDSKIPSFVLTPTAVSAPAATNNACHRDGVTPRSLSAAEGHNLFPSLPAELSALLQVAGGAVKPSHYPSATDATTSAGHASRCATTDVAAGPATAAAAAAVVAAFARPAAECPVAGYFREGPLLTDHERERGAAAREAPRGPDAFVSPRQLRLNAQPPVRVRQRLLAHQGPVHACCAVPRLWSFQLLNVCAKPSPSFPPASSSMSTSSYSFGRSRAARRLPQDIRGGMTMGRGEEEGMQEGEREPVAQEATLGTGAGPEGRKEEGRSTVTGAYGQPNDFVLTCGQDGFLALVDATRGFLAYSFLVSPFKSPLLCVDAAADRPLAVVAAADVSLYTVDTLNQRVVASLKGHTGRITACGFLRAGASGDTSLCPTSPVSSSSSFSACSGGSSLNYGSSVTSAAATAYESKQADSRRKGGEGCSRGMAFSVSPSTSNTTGAGTTTDTWALSLKPQRRNDDTSCSVGSSVAGGVYSPEKGAAATSTSTTSGFVAADKKTAGRSSSSSCSSSSSDYLSSVPTATAVTGTSGSLAAGGGGSRRSGVPRALERLVSRALRGAHGDSSATLWSGGLDRTVRFWDVERSACVKTTKLPSAVTFAAASPCGEWLAAAHQSGAVSLINARAEMGEKITTLQLHDGEPAVGVAFHPSGQWLVSVGKDKQVKVVDVRDCREVYALLHIEMRYNVVQAAPSFSPDGNYVVAAAGPHVFCWSLAEDRLRARTRLLQQRAAAPDSAGSDAFDGMRNEGDSMWNLQQQQRLHGGPLHYQGSAAKRQQVLQFSRGWAHRTRAEELQELRNSGGRRRAADELYAAAAEWQPPVSMKSQSTEIMCLDWQLQHLVTGNRDGSVCFWE